MCGITGFIQVERGGSDERLDTVVRAMTDTMALRGPDSSGYWVDAPAGVALGHRRLAIRDLSPTGHQPMVSACERYVMVYNGEVYSHDEMRADLERAGRRFRGTSDTEVMLEGCAEWGVEQTAQRLIGMFAFALYDRQTRTLSVVRDRLGIKPLYWGQFPGLFLFGSELKPLRQHPDWQPVIDRNAVSAFMRHNYIPAPHSIYQGVRKLTPGTILTVVDGVVGSERPYWSFHDVVTRGQEQRGGHSEASAIGALDGLLNDAVRRRMIADVPLGALLSGGVDSSLVTALMQANSSRPVRTFSIGFKEQGFDEAPYAKAVAKHLGTDHTELYVESNHALDIVPKLPLWYDEPFADSSQLPTFLVCELTRQHVTVVLSGDGGDELFAGYKRYELGRTIWKGANVAPSWMRLPAGRLAGRIPVRQWDQLGRLLPARMLPVNFGHRMHSLAERLTLADPDGMYRQMLSHWHTPDALVRGGAEPHGILWDPAAVTRVPDFAERMQVLRHVDLPAGRHPDQGGPRQHGGVARIAGAAARPPRGRVRLDPADRLQVARHRKQVDPQAGARSLRATTADGSAEDGLRRAVRPVDPRAAARVGRGAPLRSPVRPRSAPRARPHPRTLAGARGRRQLGLSAVERPHAARVAGRQPRRVTRLIPCEDSSTCPACSRRTAACSSP